MIEPLKEPSALVQVVQQGGVSKGTKGLNLSEDTPRFRIWYGLAVTQRVLCTVMKLWGILP